MGRHPKDPLAPDIGSAWTGSPERMLSRHTTVHFLPAAFLRNSKVSTEPVSLFKVRTHRGGAWLGSHSPLSFQPYLPQNPQSPLKPSYIGLEKCQVSWGCTGPIPIQKVIPGTRHT